MSARSEIGRSAKVDPPRYPVWSDRCWIDTAAQAEDGSATCLEGRRQRLSHPLGFRDRGMGELELRVLLGPGEDGVCLVIVEERDDAVTPLYLNRASEPSSGEPA